MNTKTLIFGGETESKRICSAELYTPGDGEPIIVTKVFQPLPEGFRVEFPDADEGKSAGGTWKVLRGKDQGDGERPDAALFRMEGYSLQYALWLIGALSAGITAAGGMEPLRGKVKCFVSGEGDEVVEAPIEDFFEVVPAGSPAAPDVAVTLHAPDAEPVGYTLVTLPRADYDALVQAAGAARDALACVVCDEAQDSIDAGLDQALEDLTAAVERKAEQDNRRSAASGDADA